MKCISEQPFPNPPLEARCGISKYQLPVVLNTQIVQSDMTKRVESIEAHSRMFNCRDLDNTQLLKDVVTFTHMYEGMDKTISEKEIESVVCMKTIVNLKVLACNLQKVA